MHKILIIDDDPDFRYAFVQLLKMLQFEATDVESVDQAFAELEKNDFALMISDQVMPEMNGLELIEKVRARFPKLPVILCTGVGLDSIKQESFAHNVTIIQKPIKIEELKEKIQWSLSFKGMILP